VTFVSFVFKKVFAVESYMSPLQKGLSHREEAKAAKEIENREDFL